MDRDFIHTKREIRQRPVNDYCYVTAVMTVFINYLLNGGIFWYLRSVMDRDELVRRTG